MSNGPIAEIYGLGQSLWLDNLNRGMIASGELNSLIDAGEISGVTSNPTIFDRAFSESNDYDAATASLLRAEPEMSQNSKRLVVWRNADD